MLEVDIDRIETARRRDHRDVRGAQLVDPHAQHQFVGFQHLLGAVLADLRGHDVPPRGFCAAKHRPPCPRTQRSDD